MTQLRDPGASSSSRNLIDCRVQVSPSRGSDLPTLDGKAMKADRPAVSASRKEHSPPDSRQPDVPGGIAARRAEPSALKRV